MSEASDITGATIVRAAYEAADAKFDERVRRVSMTDDDIDAVRDAERNACAAKSQAFFAQLRESVRPGYVSDTHKQFVETLLRQAQTAGLFDPEAT